MIKKIVCLGIVAAGICAALYGGEEQPNQVREFMRRKLPHSQKVFEGLVTEDFDSIARHAQELSLLSQASTWQVVQTPEYLYLSTEFRHSADKLTEAAQEKPGRRDAGLHRRHAELRQLP